MNHERTVNLPIVGWTRTTSVALLLNRLSLGLLFLLAGIGKLRMGSGKFYRDVFLTLKPSWLPEPLASPYGHALPFLETAVGALLILGLFARLTAGAATVMLASFTIALLAAGMFFQGGAPFHTNVILFTLAVLLAAAGPGRYSVDSLLHRCGIEHVLLGQPSGADKPRP